MEIHQEAITILPKTANPLPPNRTLLTKNVVFSHFPWTELALSKTINLERVFSVFLSTGKFYLKLCDSLLQWPRVAIGVWRNCFEWKLISAALNSIQWLHAWVVITQVLLKASSSECSVEDSFIKSCWLIENLWPYLNVGPHIRQESGLQLRPKLPPRRASSGQSCSH